MSGGENYAREYEQRPVPTASKIADLGDLIARGWNVRMITSPHPAGHTLVDLEGAITLPSGIRVTVSVIGQSGAVAQLFRDLCAAATGGA